jgi:hypothetical protein
MPLGVLGIIVSSTMGSLIFNSTVRLLGIGRTKSQSSRKVGETPVCLTGKEETGQMRDQTVILKF